MEWYYLEMLDTCMNSNFNKFYLLKKRKPQHFRVFFNHIFIILDNLLWFLFLFFYILFLENIIILLLNSITEVLKEKNITQVVSVIESNIIHETSTKYYKFIIDLYKKTFCAPSCTLVSEESPLWSCLGHGHMDHSGTYWTLSSNGVGIEDYEWIHREIWRDYSRRWYCGIGAVRNNSLW